MRVRRRGHEEGQRAEEKGVKEGEGEKATEAEVKKCSTTRTQ